MPKNLIAFFAVMAIALIASTGFVLAQKSQAEQLQPQPAESSTSMQNQCPCQTAGLDCNCTDNGQPCSCGQNGATCGCSGASSCHSN